MCEKSHLFAIEEVGRKRRKKKSSNAVDVTNRSFSLLLWLDREKGPYQGGRIILPHLDLVLQQMASSAKNVFENPKKLIKSSKEPAPFNPKEVLND